MPHSVLLHLAWAMGLVCWITAQSLNFWGSSLAYRHFRNRRRPKTTRERPFPQPISILKPIKGIDGNLAKNLESFFHLKYVKFELLLSIADETDPARPIIEEMIARFPNVNARLIIGERKLGPNPKINNLAQSYQQALYDWLLISDSNVAVQPDYLFTVTENFTSDVGIVTAVVSGQQPEGVGAWLEAVFLNTFYARWMFISGEVGNPVVVGKSMLFRKSDAERFGGLATLSRYLAEDYMSGIAMVQLNRRIETMSQPIVQPLGRYSFRAFWSRHLRWGRIRKSQAPLVFCIEPALTFWASGLLGAWAASSTIGAEGSWFMASFFGLHAGLWLLSDLIMLQATRARLGWRAIPAWFLRETLALPLWLHVACGRSVLWRGRKLRLTNGGLLES